VRRREIGDQRVVHRAVHALGQAESDDHRAEHDDGGRAVEPGAGSEDAEARAAEDDGRGGKGAQPVVPAERLGERQLCEHQHERVDEEDRADPGLADARVLLHERRQHRRDLRVRGGYEHRRQAEQPEEPAVARDLAVAAAHASGRGDPRRRRHEQQQPHERDEGAGVDGEEQVVALRDARRRDQAADQAADAEAEVVGDARERVGGGALLSRGERREQARVARREARVPGAGDRREGEGVPRMANEGKAAVAGGEQRERGHQRAPSTHAVDDPARERAADDTDPEQHRHDEPRGAEAHSAHLVEVDDQERDHDPVTERVRDPTDFEQPDGARELRLQALEVRGDCFQSRTSVLRIAQLA